MANQTYDIDYQKLASFVVQELKERNLLEQLAPRSPKKQTKKGRAIWVGDDCTFISFDMPDFAQNERLRFRKEGHGSWEETVKHSHRKSKTICVTYDEHQAEAVWYNDEVFLTYPPIDIHDE